jgi:Domain of unknown function (DUF5916)
MRPPLAVMRHRPLLLAATLWWVSVCPAWPQTPEPAALPPEAVSVLAVEPPPPLPPATIARDAEGRATVRAIRLAQPLAIDGRLDEAVYASVPPISDFIQMEPNGGEPATERTEVWILFDNANVYVSMRAWESQPDRLIATEMRRDSNNIRQGDSVAFGLDTSYDRRNAFQFEVNALGARTDGQSTNERQYSADWNPVWNVRASRFEGGWSVEAALPFKSLRYRAGRAQIWGFQARRTNKWKNEISYLTRVPPSFGIGRGSFAASLYATLVGLEAPETNRLVEIKPYAVADLTTDRIAADPFANRVDGDVGADAKVGLTENLTADFTYNTDFAQVEADEQQVNLTRFSLFFPEKRDFFLENLGTFTFGNVFPGGAATGGDSGDAPILFYSRRIGLDLGQQIPILGGGRMTGRAGPYTIGALNIQTRELGPVPATNFSVLRLKRDVLQRSAVGVLATARSAAQNGPGANAVFGLDGTFQFFDNLAINTYWAATRTEGLEGDDMSFRAQLDYAGDRYGAQVEALSIGDNFNPEVGFLRRDDIDKRFVQLRFSPRPRNARVVRKLSWIGAWNYIEDGAGRVATRTTDGEFAIELQNSDRFSLGVNDAYELLVRPFPIAPPVVIPVGGYAFTTGRVGYAFGQQRPWSGNLLVEAGSFYDGERTTVAFSRGRLNLSARFSVEPSVSINRVRLPYGSFVTSVAGARLTYTMTPRMFVSGLVQYNSASNLASANVRFRWEYHPGSELFVVWNEERDSRSAGVPDLQNRALILKITRLIRF